MLRGLLLILSLLLPADAAKRYQAKVLSAHDGDTVRVQVGSKELRIRLLGLDTPEIDQAPWGARARIALCTALGSVLCDFKNTKIRYEYDNLKQDKYGRELAYIYNAKGELVNELLLKSGYAVVFILEPNTRYATRLKDAEVYARKHNLAIWQPEFGLTQSPYEFRKRKFKTQRKGASR